MSALCFLSKTSCFSQNKMIPLFLTLAFPSDYLSIRFLIIFSKHFPSFRTCHAFPFNHLKSPKIIPSFDSEKKEMMNFQIFSMFYVIKNSGYLLFILLFFAQHFSNIICYRVNESVSQVDPDAQDQLILHELLRGYDKRVRPPPTNLSGNSGSDKQV